MIAFLGSELSVLLFLEGSKVFLKLGDVSGIIRSSFLLPFLELGDGVIKTLSVFNLQRTD